MFGGDSSAHNAKILLLSFFCTQAIVMDEVFCVSAASADLIEALLTEARKLNPRLNVWLMGDSNQLLPFTAGAKPLHESDAWSRFDICLLETPMRQSNPDDPIAVLSRSQHNAEPTPELVLDALVDRIKHTDTACPGGKLPNDLMPHTVYVAPMVDPVKAHNNRMLNQLKGDSVQYKAVDTNPEEPLLERLPLPAELELKVGAQVRLILTLDVARGLVSGRPMRINELKPDTIIVQLSDKKLQVCVACLSIVSERLRMCMAARVCMYVAAVVSIL
jgi:hypothetical protein